MTTLEIRPGLHIHVHTISASAYIRWWLPDAPSAMFNPCDSSFRPHGDEPCLEKVLSSIAPDDLARIKSRLLQYNRDRLHFIREDNARIRAANTTQSPLSNPAPSDGNAPIRTED